MTLTRRVFLTAGTATAAMAAVTPRVQAQARWESSPVRYPDPAVQILDPSFTKYRVGNAAVERLATGFRWSEGVVNQCAIL